MNTQTDQELLRDYAGSRSESAFAELVRRHVDLVFSAALRMVCDSHLAQDVTQGVFIALANNAGQLTHHPVLSGWLHRTTQNLAANAVRTNVRRQMREQEAVTMNELLSHESEAVWENIAPHLDTALGELSEPDRDALLLRYFERKSAREMAQTLNVSEEAAQKRVNRAVERLREFFSKRNVTVGASGLVVLITTNSVQAAPVGLFATISSAVSLVGTAVQTSTPLAATKTIAMTTLQKTLITISLTAAVGVGIFEGSQASQLREQNQLLQRKEASLTGQIAQLQTENERLSNIMVQAKNGKSLSQAQFSELLKLRGQTALARTAVDDLAKLKSDAAEQSALPAFLTNAMAQGLSTAEKFKKKEALAKVARLKKQLHLSDDQAAAISDIMVENIESNSQQTLDAMMGKPTQDQASSTAARNEESEIKALLTPGQLANYPEFERAETILSAENSAQGDLMLMKGEMELSLEQQSKIHSALYQLNLNHESVAENQDAIAQARASGNLSDVINLQIETQKQTLEDKLNALDGILTPSQLKLYEQKRSEMIDMQTSAMKMFLPQAANGPAR